MFFEFNRNLIHTIEFSSKMSFCTDYVTIKNSYLHNKKIAITYSLNSENRLTNGNYDFKRRLEILKESYSTPMGPYGIHIAYMLSITEFFGQLF